MSNSKNAKLSISTIHNRAHKADPKPKNGICEICGKVADKNGIIKLIHSNKDHSYNLPIVPDDWQWIHYSCHKKHDIECNIIKKGKITTVQMLIKTRDRLKKNLKYRRQTYDELLNDLMDEREEAQK